MSSQRTFRSMKRDVIWYVNAIGCRLENGLMNNKLVLRVVVTVIKFKKKIKMAKLFFSISTLQFFSYNFLDKINTVHDSIWSTKTPTQNNCKEGHFNSPRVLQELWRHCHLTPLHVFVVARLTRVHHNGVCLLMIVNFELYAQNLLSVYDMKKKIIKPGILYCLRAMIYCCPQSPACDVSSSVKSKTWKFCNPTKINCFSSPVHCFSLHLF